MLHNKWKKSKVTSHSTILARNWTEESKSWKLIVKGYLLVSRVKEVIWEWPEAEGWRRGIWIFPFYFNQSYNVHFEPYLDEFILTL